MIWLPEMIPSAPDVLGASAALAAEMPMSERNRCYFQKSLYAMTA
jgi:hypothetical protein